LDRPFYAFRRSKLRFTHHQIFNVTIIIGAAVSVVGYWDTVAAPRLIASK
jgi:hypothetical protein